MLIKIIITACTFPSGDDGDSVLLRKEAHLAATRCRVTGDGMAFVKTFAVPCREGRGGDGTRVKQDIISLMSSPGLWSLYSFGVTEPAAPAAQEK